MSGEIGHPEDLNSKLNRSSDQNTNSKLNKSSDQNTKKSEAWRRNLGNTKKEGSKTGKLEGTPTHKLRDNSETSKFDAEWGKQQLDLYWRGSGHLKEAKSETDKLGVDLTPGVTKELQTEATQKLGDQDAITPLTSKMNTNIERIAERQKNQVKFEDLSSKEQEKIVRTRVLESKSRLML